MIEIVARQARDQLVGMHHVFSRFLQYQLKDHVPLKLGSLPSFCCNTPSCPRFNPLAAGDILLLTLYYHISKILR